MKRREFVGLAAFFWLIRADLVNAQDEKNVYASAVRWFQALLRPLDQLGDAIDRNRFLQKLTQLGNAFEAMIADKREIAGLVNEVPVPVENLSIIVDRLALNVRLTKERLTQVAFFLKQQLRDQGNKIAADLDMVLLERKSWVRLLQADLGNNQPLQGYAQEATASANALDKANTELAKVVARIRAA